MKEPTIFADPTPWDEEELIVDGDYFYLLLERGIRAAQSSIDLEMYIFDNDRMGERVVQWLLEAHARGVAVRVIVDGIGSKGWIYNLGKTLDRAGIPRKIFHQLPWERIFSKERDFDSDSTWGSLYTRLNSRNHRKVCIFDKTSALMGSLNISEVHSKTLAGEKAWVDFSIRIKGEAVKYLCGAFDAIWFPRRPRFRRQRKIARYLIKRSEGSAVQLNATRHLRHKNFHQLLHRFSLATKRIWIANAYFVPTRSLISELSQAAARGVEVRILIPSISDVFFMPWVAGAFHQALLCGGAQVYEYLPSFLHAKAMVIDDYAIIGTSNLNDRSLIHDLEVDIVSKLPITVESLVGEFSRCFARSRQITIENCQNYPWFFKLLGRIALIFRHWI